VRVVVPYAVLAPETRAALEADGVVAEYVFVGADPTAYHGLVERLWSEGDGFLIVEQDIVVRPGSVAELADCPEPWCGFAYSIGTSYGSYLGCARFGRDLVLGHPGVFAAVANLRDDGTPRRYWGRLDTRMKAVLEDHEGQRMHVHWPALDHLNTDKGTPIVNCVQCGAAIPDEIVRQGPPVECPRCA
jgi:hypothetical protein